MKSGIDILSRSLVFDHTSLTHWRECPRRWYWRIQRGLESKPYGMDPSYMDTVPKSIELQFGTSIHTALDVLYETGSVEAAKHAFVSSMEGSSDDPLRSIERGQLLLSDYYKHWRSEDSQWKLLQAEAPFSFTFSVFDELKQEWSVTYHGIIDKILVAEDGYLQIRDHKTTKWAPTGRIDAYSLSTQGLGYLRGLSLLMGETALSHSSMLFDLLILNPKNNDFRRSDPIIPHPHLMRQFLRGIEQTARMIISTHLRSEQEPERPWEVFPMHAPDACNSWNRRCAFWYLCDSDPGAMEDTLEAQYYYSPWDTERRK